MIMIRPQRRTIAANWDKIDNSRLGNFFKFKIVPEPISQEETLKQIKDQMKIPE